MNTINDEKKHFNNNNENENIENSIILNINSIEVDKKLNSTSIKGSNYLEKNDNTESINDKNDYNKSESPILLSVGDYSENIKNPPLISYQACSENSKDQIIENSVRLNLNDANKYEENYNNNLSLKLNPFNKIHSIDELVIRNENVAKKKFNGLDSSYKYSNWEIKNGDFNDSQNSIKASTSALKNKMSGSYIRLKLDDKDVDSFKNKNNLFNIYINSNDSDDSLNESNKSDNNSLNIQRSFSKYRKSRTSSILITGIKSGSSPGTSVATTSNSHELTIPVLNQDSFPVLTPENNSNSSEKLNESQKNSDEAKSTHSELIENQLNLLDSMSTIRINDNEINNNNDNSYNISQNNIDSVNSSRIKLSSGSIEDKNLEYDEAEQINLANINANKNRNIAVKDEMTKVMDNEKHDDKEWKDTSSEHFEEIDKYCDMYSRNQKVMASYENIQNNELNFKNILSVAGKLKYSNILFNVDSKNFCKCCLGINSKIKNNAVINCKCSCKGHEHGTFNMEDVLRTANDKIYNKFNVNKEKDIKEIRSKDEIEISDKESVVYEPEPYGNENYIVYSYDHYNKSNESSTESIYKRLFNNIFLIDKSESDINISNNEAKKDGEINKVNIEDDLQNLNKKLNINEDLNQYEQFLTEEENECIRNIERNNDKFKRINVTTGYMGKGLLRLNRNPEFSKLVQDPLNISTNNEEELNQSTIENESTNSNVSLSSLQKSTPHIESSAASNIVIPTSKKKKVESPIIKDKKEFIDQKNLIDEKILEKIQKNRFLNKRLLKNENIFNILTNPIIKISKKKYYNYNKYYRNGILKKRNIGKILYNNYVIQTGPFRNYFSKEGHNIFNRYLYSSSGDLYLHQPYTSKYEYSSYNSINAKKLTYIKHNHPNCKIKMKPHDVVKIGKPKKALLKWNDHSFSRIPTISKKVHHFNANKYLFELNDSILTNEEEQTYECCPKKYDSVCYRKNLYKLQREILTDYIKESTAIISQKYPNIGGWGNLPDDNYKKIKDNQLTEEDDESTEEEENKELNMKNIYPKNMTLDEYLRMYEEMLENKLKKPIKKETKSHIPKIKEKKIINRMMNSVIREINNVTWVNKDEQQQIINIFISEVTFRYSKMESFIRKISKNPDNYNQLLKQMFIRLNNIKDEILDFCLQRKNRLDKIGIFNEKTNIDRVLTEFRTELRRKMDEEMWYLQTNNKLKEEKEKNEKRELTFEEKFKNEFNDMNQQLSELKGSPVDLVIPPIIDEINSKKKSKELKEEINKIIIKEISEEKKISDTEHQKYLKSVIKKRKEMFKEDFDKAEKSYKSDDDDENFNKVHDNKVTEYKDIEQDLTKLSNREYEQNREYVKRKGIKLQYLTIDDDNVDKEKSLSLSEKIKNLFNNLKNHSDYNLLIGRTLIDSHLKDIKEDLKDEYTNEMYEKIKNINNKYEWKTLFNSDNTLENELYGNEDEILNNNLLQYKLYPFNRPKKIYKPEKKKHSYYLEKSHLNHNNKEFNYDDLDELEEEIKILQEKYDDTILNDLNFDTTTPMRIHGLMRSENDDVGLWKIDTTLDIMCKFENPNELERHKDLDEKLNMNKEAENLYKEISKFILHKDSDFHDLESENKIIAAPSCYLDDENKILFSNCNEQIIVFDSEKEKREKEIKKETPEKIDYKPTIKLLTHKAGKFHVNADKYYRNRSKAMKLTQSSKYESLEYNFGGYIPAYVIKKKKDKMKNETILTMDEYKKYVINLRCDFLHDIIIKDSIEKQRRSDEKYYHGLLRKELKNHDEKSQIKLFKNKYKKYKYKSHEIRNTKDGYWNPEVLDYMNALSRQKIIGNIKGLDINNGNSKNINTNILTNDKKKENQVNANDSDKNSGNENSIESKDNNKSKDSISSKEIYESKRTIETKENSESNENESKNNNDSNKSRGTTAISKSSWDEEGYDDVDDDINLPPNPCNSYVNSDDELSDTISKYFTLNNNIDKPYESIESGTYMTLPSMQEAMECIFDRLKMPVNEKIDLAIKYGSYEFSMKFIEAISCWNIVSKLIIKREEKLDRIREFETKISNPYRFFKSGESSLITARFVEDLQRKDFVKDLEPLNKRIIKLCIKIYKKYGDVIKYEGKPYIEKIKNDYSNIIKHAYREFEKKQNEVPYSLKF